MRSAPTARRWPATERLPLGSLPAPDRCRRARRFTAALPLIVLLAGCGGGSVNDARLGAARDAQAPPRLDQQEATSTAAEYFPPTPTPPPHLPPPPTLDTLEVALSVGPGDVPQQNLASVPADAGTVYASALLSELVAGQRIDAVWTDAFSNEVGRSQQTVTGNAGQQWIALPLAMNGQLAAGEYAVYLFADGRRLGSVVFVVAPPGSVAQEFPPPPENPRVSVQPTAAPVDQGGQPRDQNGGVTNPTANGVQESSLGDPNAGQPVAPTYPPQ